MPEGYLPILIFLAVAIAFPVVTIIAAKLVRPYYPTTQKLEAYECGIRAASDSRGRYTVRFYLVAILFLVFDVELLFLYPWAVSAYTDNGVPAELRNTVFGVMLVFMATLAIAFIYAWRKGVFRWR